MGVPKVRSSTFDRCCVSVRSACPIARISPKCTPTPTLAHCTQVLGVLPAFWDGQPVFVGIWSHGMAFSEPTPSTASCDGGHSTCHGSRGDKCPHCTTRARNNCTHCRMTKQRSVTDALHRTFCQMELATWASATLSCLAVGRPDPETWLSQR